MKKQGKYNIYESIEEIAKVANLSIGDKHPFSEFDTEGKLKNNKGGIGEIVESGLFGIEHTTAPLPDFENLGIELKVTPFIFSKKGDRKAKERLVLGIIDYLTENVDSFYDSHFWFKNQKLFIMFYNHNFNIPKDMWFIDDFIFFTWPEEDLKIVKDDWSKIVKKIKEGRAHELSESDTNYLAACTKGENSKSTREQRCNGPRAKQRAYSLKQSYMTYILNNYVYSTKQIDNVIKSNNFLSNEKDSPYFGVLENEKIIKDITQLDKKSFRDLVIDMFKPYYGKTQKELIKLFNIKDSKQANASIVRSILKVNGDVSKTEEFQKANIEPKTIRIEKNGLIKESMSTQTFEFLEIIDQDWEDSDFYNFVHKMFMFILFQKVDEMDENSYLKEVKFWGMSEEDIAEAERCFNETKETIDNGVVLTRVNNTFENNLPKQSKNRVAHVRPKASKSYYKINGIEYGDNPSNGSKLKNGDYMTRQCFWLNRLYISSVINK